jgi:hypothetical protein
MPPQRAALRAQRLRVGPATKHIAELPIGGSAIFRPAWRLETGVAEERGSVALRPRLSPGLPLSRSLVCEDATVGAGTTGVNRAGEPPCQLTDLDPSGD